jgi:ribose transport system permease protein
MNKLATLPTIEGPDSRRRPGIASRMDLAKARDLGIVLAFLILFVTLSLASDVFLTPTNLGNVLEQWAPVAIMAVAGTFVLIAGGLDISVGAIYAISGVMAAQAVNATGSIAVGCVVACAVGLAFGIANGAITTLGRVNSLIATLGSGLMIRGLALVATGGFIVVVENQAFRVLGGTEVLGLRWSAWIMFGWVLALSVLLHRTVFGRWVFAVGGNAEAARLSGIRVDGVKAATFALSGLAAGIAGLLAASKVGAGQAEVGVGMEFQVLAAIVLGGNSMLGGAGAIWRTVLGVFMLAMIGNGLNLLAVDPVYQQIVQGAIVVLAVALDAWTQRTRKG